MTDKKATQKSSKPKLGFSFSKNMNRTPEQIKYLEASRQEKKELTYFI